MAGEARKAAERCDWPNPFYWSNRGMPNHAPSGWYVWTVDGLKFLGESILEKDDRAQQDSANEGE